MIIFQGEQTNFSIDYVWQIDKYYTIRVFVKSKEFQGAHDFCISIDELNDIRSKLSTIESSLEGTVIINDYDSDSFVKINCNLDTKVELSGQLGASYDNNYMKFLIKADQTIVTTMISCIIDLLR